MADIKPTNMNIPKAAIFDLVDILELQKTAFHPVADLLAD